MNGPGVTSDVRPQYGLPYRQLPGTAQRDLTPEAILNEQIATGRRQIQDRFNLQWQEMNRSMGFIGGFKTQRMLQELHARAKQEMLQFDQQAQEQLAQLQNINQLVAVGGMVDVQAKKIKARMVFGRDAAEAMYPEPQRERTILQQIDALDLSAYRVEDRLAQFREVRRGPWDEKWFARKTWLGWPFPKEKKKLVTQIYDPTIPTEDEEGVITMGSYRPATEEELKGEKLLRKQKELMDKQKRELRKKYLEQTDVSQRIVPSGIRGGGFDIRIAESIRGPVTRQPTTEQILQQQPQITDPLGLR